MNPLEAMSSDDQNVIEFSDNPGRRLRVLRQSRGLEVARVAAQLHLRVPMVEALEQDRYQDLPGPVFIAGYLRNYARLLGLDPEPLLAAYRQANPAPEPAALRFMPPPRPEIGSGHILVRLISLGLVAAVIAMSVWWWQNRAAQLPETSPSATAGLALATPSAGNGPATATTPNLPIPAAEAARPESAPAPAPDTDLPPPPAAPTDASPGGAESATPAPDAASDAANPSANPTEVSVTFTGRTWVNIRDAKGVAVLTGDVRKGDTRVLTGSPPYTMVIGHARLAQVTVGGRPLNLAGRSKGGVARFKLDPADVK
ncbi:MAG TPA: RodZ family helix-turn-helix domain-containing protein [Lamprocystis sp. (in: g-proteobacteria)]|nr:RodZ family helix-turn-helix domain-containing protein [Lamprocystis sp. (in: g-proteobacteria)]